MTRNHTASEILSDFFALMQGSPLAQAVDGNVYRDGYRPRNSNAEDIIVIHTAGNTISDDTGIITINIYLRDIDPYSDGTYHCDGQRAATIERMLQDWVDSITPITNNYLIVQQDTIRTAPLPEQNQHFVVAMLHYTRYDIQP